MENPPLPGAEGLDLLEPESSPTLGRGFRRVRLNDTLQRQMGEGFTLPNICSHHAAWKLLIAPLHHLLNAHTLE